jgi:hypothetical protein
MAATERLEAHVRGLARIQGKARGSGYAVTAGLVLTSGHVVGDVGSDCVVWPESGGEHIGMVRWRADHLGLDAALVEVLGEVWAPAGVGWAELRGAGYGECLVLGYPWVSKDGTGPRVAELACRASPTPSSAVQRYELHLVDAPPRDRLRESGEKRPSSWAGLSGGPLLTKDGSRVLGVVRADNPRFHNSALGAERIVALLDDDVFARLVNAKREDVRTEWTGSRRRTVSRGMSVAILAAAVALTVGATVAIAMLGGDSDTPEAASPDAPPVKVQDVTTFKTSKQDGKLVLPAVVTMTPTEVGSFKDGTASTSATFQEWYGRHGGVALNSGFTNITVQGNDRDPVRITDMKVLKNCGHPVDGTVLQGYTQGGGEDTVKIGFDLDQPDPIPERMALVTSGLMGLGTNYFADRTVVLARGESQTITVGAYTRHSHCKFTFRLVVATSNGTFTQDVDAGGRPFEVSAEAMPKQPNRPYSGYRAAYVQNELLVWQSVDPTTYGQK